MVPRRVVVTGLGAITPVGNNVPEYWNGLLNGVSGAGEITRFDASKFKCRIACEVKGFDPLDFFDKKEARKLDSFAQFAIVAADEAIADSGITKDNTDFDEVGVIFGSGIGGIDSLFNDMRDFALGDGTPRLSPFIIPRLLPDLAAGHISIKYGLHGANFATVSACASSANALIEGFNFIHFGKADVMVVGGSEAAICPVGVGGFEAMKALSTRNDNPATASRPFDVGRDGFVMGEGAGCLIIEELNHAIARGATIYGEIAGSGVSGDAYHMTAPHPEGFGAALSMRRALKDAGITAEMIDHINTHGTSTQIGDVTEVLAIKEVFGEHTYKISVNSGKSMTGHLLGGAGAIEAISTVLACKNDIVPPTINHFSDDPAIDPAIDFTFEKPRKRVVNYAISNAFGFGGHNASIVFKKY
ncbi:MAG: beta-ketoacyl-ACP synthase II [Bacteroidales bacterium]|nr:beta-ketoacyl-ACP synthase II [Bacteroidales bacterium]